MLLSTAFNFLFLLSIQLIYKTVIVIAECKMKDSVVIFIKKLIAIGTNNIADNVKCFGAVTEQYILAAALILINLIKNFAQLRFIKLGLNTFCAPYGTSAAVIRVRCFYIN